MVQGHQPLEVMCNVLLEYLCLLEASLWSQALEILQLIIVNTQSIKVFL